MTTSVRVILEIEVEVGVWGDHTTFAQLKAQAEHEAIQIVRSAAEGRFKVEKVVSHKYVTFERNA